MKSFLKSVKEMFDRDIQKAIDEISRYDNEDDLWILPSGISNTAGNLALHLAGNLQHFIGTILGKTGYERNRPEEFEAREIPKDDIINELIRAKNTVHETLSMLNPEEVSNNYPESFYNQAVSTHFMLVHLYGHLNYHLGQINYHRRLLAV